MGQHQSSLPHSPHNPSTLPPSRPAPSPHAPLPVDRHRLRSLFTKFELRAARQGFAAIKTVYNDGFECIEEKAFVKYLALPPHLTPASHLLFKSFSYLGSHPNSSIVGPVPLSFDALLATLAILCRKSKDISSQDADRFIFDSFAAVHAAPPTAPPISPTLVAVELENGEGGPVPIAIADAMGDEIERRGKETKDQKTSRGFTLADMGISFEDEDDDSGGNSLSRKEDAAARSGSGGTNDEDDEGGFKMLARDLIELMTAFLWMVKVESDGGSIDDGAGGDGGGSGSSGDADGDAVKETARLRRMESPEWVRKERRLARDIAKAVSQLDDRLHGGLPPNAIVEQSAEFDELTASLSWRAFSAWKLRNAPNLFLTLQSFIYTRFLVGFPAALSTTSVFSSSPITPSSPSFPASRPLSTSSVESALPLHTNQTPCVDVTDILESVHIALLTWCLPAHVIRQKHWERLYSGSVDGFSMNRFEQRVFKYPGPTLLLLQVEARGGERSSAYGSSPVAESSGFFSGSPSPTHRVSSYGSSHTPSAHDNDTQTMILGAYIAEPWHPSRHAWGNSDHFLFELSPTFELFPTTSRNQQYVYYNPSFGIGFGGWDPLGVQHSSSPSTPVTTSPPTSPTFSRTPRLTLAASSTYLLTLSNTLQTGTYVNEVFPPLPTVKPSAGRGDFTYTFDVVEVEVFGFGGEEARAAQAKEWTFENKEATRRATIHVRKEGAGVDKDMLKLAGIIDDEGRQDR